MKVAIIGAGSVGRALAGSSIRAGHTVVLSSAHHEHAVQAARATGAEAAASNRSAVDGADAVILAVPYAAVSSILDELGDALDGGILIDATNPLTPDYTDLATDGDSAAELIQQRVPGARVVKAFNTAFAARQANPQVDGVQLDGFVAGDDPGAKEAVLDLVGSIGFRPIDAGPLRMSRALEQMALLTISLQLRNGWSWQNGWKLAGPTSA